MTIEERKKQILDKITQMQADEQDMRTALEILGAISDENNNGGQ